MDVKKFLFEGNKTPNPEYNPKTKKGATQPPFLVNYNPGTDETTKIRSSIAKQILLNTDFLNTEEYDKYAKYDTYLSSNSNIDDLNKERANNQGWGEQTWRMLVQAGLGEVFYGSLEGFGNIWDGAKSLVTGGDYERSQWTKYFEKKKEDVKANNEIYQIDPGKAFALNDWGWWMQNMVTVATTASLALPAAGWMKGLGLVGKATKLNKLGNSLIRATSRGLAKGAKAAAETTKFGALRSMAGKAGRIESTIKNAGAIAMQAAISRTGENFMEAKAVYDDIAENTLKNINGMIEYDKKNNTNEFDKFIERNPEFKNEDGTIKTPEEISKIIATESANKTFYGDYAMLFSDFLQLKALGGLWGKQAAKSPTAAQRIAAENAKRMLAGKTGKELIENNLLNKTKYALKDVLKHPFTSLSAMQLEEGFEEIYQGIYSEKGYEVAAKYFDPSFTPKTLYSYIQDGHIWEQGLWGIIGGIGYNGVVKGIQEGGKKIEGLWNKSHMTAEEYERWKKSNDKIAAEHLAGVTYKAKDFANKMQLINQNINPFEYIIDPVTRKEIFKDGKLVNETIDDVQKELLKERAIDDFIKPTTYDSVDAGTFELLSDILSSQEFNQFVDSNKKLSSAEDTALTQQIIQRMKDIEGIYTSELANINSMSDSSNPFVERLAARSITNTRLKIEEYDHIIANIDKRIDALNTSNENYIPNIIDIESQYATELIDSLHNRYNSIRNDNSISKTAKAEMLNEIDKLIKEINSIIGVVSSEKLLTEPPTSIEDLIKKRAEARISKAYQMAMLPKSDKDYQRAYEEFGRSLDQVIINRLTENINTVKNYLRKSSDFDSALERLLNESTENKKVNEAISFLRYGYNSIYDNEANSKNVDLITNAQLLTVIEEIRKERNKAEEVINDAEDAGSPLPVVKERKEEVYPSTGKEAETSTTTVESATPKKEEETATTDLPVDETLSTEAALDPKDDSSELPFVDTVDENAPDASIDESIAAVTNVNEDDELTEKQKEEYADIAKQSESAREKAEFAASEHIAKLASTNKELFEKINKEYASGNKTTYDKLIKDIVDLLIANGYNERVAKPAAEAAFNRVVLMFSDLDSKSVFYKLGTQLAQGFKLEGKDLNASTGEITNEEIDELVKDFIDEYSRLVENVTTDDGKVIINISDIIKKLLEENVPVNIASKIYNNLGKFIARYNGDKYVFTGYRALNETRAKDFIDKLLQRSQQVIDAAELMHISPLEEVQRTSNYREALIAAANGANTRVVEQRDQKGEVTNLSIEVELQKGRKKEWVKIGTLRTVTPNSTLSEFSPVSHWSGFKNVITIGADGSISLDCDNFFEQLIAGSTEDAKTLLNKIIKYRLKVKEALSKQDTTEIAKALDEALTDEDVTEILNNKLVRDILDSGVYKFYDKTGDKNKDNVKKLINTIANILFYDSAMEVSDNINSAVDNMNVSKSGMTANYSTWKKAVEVNYKHTYELQKGIAKDDAVFVDLNVTYFTHLNVVDNIDDFNNIGDLPFNLIPDHKPNSKYTPFVMVNNKGKIIGEDGTDYGTAPIEIGEYSMGYLVSNEQGLPKIAYCRNRVALPQDSKLLEALGQEIKDIFVKQFNNGITTDTHNHSDEFDAIIKKCNEVFGPGGIFTFEGVFINVISDSIINVRFDKQNLTGFSIFKSSRVAGSDRVVEGTGIRITGFTGTAKDFTSLSDANAEAWIDSLIKELKKRVRINKSATAFNRKDKNGVTPNMIDTTNGKFTIRLGGQTFVYENYGDFIKQSRGFLTDVEVRNGSLVTNVLNEDQITIDMQIKDRKSVGQVNTDVTDLLFDKEKKKNETVRTEELLEAAGVDKDKINVLMGVGTGIQLLSKRTYIDDSQSDTTNVDKLKVNAKYSKSEDKVYVTYKGAMSMNSNPSNAIRLLLHENLHRAFEKKGKYSQEEKNRIVTELKEVFEYTKDKLYQDYTSGRITKEFYDSVIKVFNEVTINNTGAVAMEEFLVECLTQQNLTEYLNNTEYKEQSIVDGITQKNKTLFQKIIDIILKLFGINDGNIKNNSILARQYLILAKGNKSTASGTLLTPIVANTENIVEIDNTKSPVEGETINDTFSGDEKLELPEDLFGGVELFANTDYISDKSKNIINDKNADEKYAKTEQITATEIFANPIINGVTNSPFGVQIVNDINSFVNSFPMQYRANIQQILAENDLNYTCQ